MIRLEKEGKMRMEISVFSVLMTVLWSSVLIALFYLLRTKTGLLHICSISTVILLYLFCAVRIAFPIELPWTRVVPGGAVYNGLRNALYYEIGSVSIYKLFFVIWIAGILCNLCKYLIQYHHVIHYIQSIPKTESGTGRDILDALDKGNRIEIIRISAVKSPCCIGIFKKRILLPDKEYGREELRYILLHEYTHLCSSDILLKALIMALCWIYWWNPIVYLLQKDLSQSIEIRCDLSVAKHLNENERADYLTVMLDAFRESRQADQYAGAVGFVDKHSESLVERFRIVADMGVVQKNRANAFAGFIMLLVLTVSYSFIFQSKYEAPISEIVTDENIYHANPENAYIIKQGDTYILHTADAESIVSEKIVKMMLEDGFAMKGGE